MEPEQIKPFLRIVFLRCMKMLRNREEAMDAMQEVMLRYYDACSKRQVKDPLSYLCRTSMNHCIDRLKHLKQTVPLESIAEISDKGPSLARVAEGQWMVSHLLRVLSQDELRLFLHRHVEQMTYEEIGRLYSLSDRGMKKRLKRIEERVRRFLQEPGAHDA